MIRIVEIASWYLLVIGILHAMATPYFHRTFTTAAVWFALGGIAFAGVGLINLGIFRWGLAVPTFHLLAAAMNMSVAVGAGLVAYEAWPHFNALAVAVCAAVAGSTLMVGWIAGSTHLLD